MEEISFPHRVIRISELATQMIVVKCLVLADTLSGWDRKVYPARSETAAQVAKGITKRNNPPPQRWSGVPGSLESDSGPAFVSQVTK